MQDTSNALQRPLVSPTGWKLLVGSVRGAIGGFFLFAFLILINALQMASLVLFPFSRRLFRAFNRACANTWWGTCVLCGEYIYGVQPVLTGDVLPPKENALIVANHQQMPDIVVLMILAWSKSRLGDLKWFVKDPIKYVPGIGWGLQFLDCLFVKRNWDSDEGKIRRTFAKFLRDGIPLWLISFSEGTRLKPKKLAASQQFARERGWRVPKHTLVPRTKGFVASVIGLRTYATAVYDVTIAYGGGVPTLWQYLCGWSRDIHVHIRRYPMSSMPASDEAVAQWLRARFEEKDALLETYFRDGRFPQARSQAEILGKDQPALFPFIGVPTGGATPEA